MISNQSNSFLLEQDVLAISGAALLELLQVTLERHASFRFYARGSSMTPFIQDGDLIWIEPLDTLTFHLGDVLAFIHPAQQRLIIHRLLRTKEGACFFQGDNLPGHPDGWIQYEDLLGRVSRVERRGRRVRLGMGPERSVVALLSKSGLLQPLAHIVGRGYSLWRSLSSETRLGDQRE